MRLCIKGAYMEEKTSIEFMPANNMIGHVGKISKYIHDMNGLKKSIEFAEEKQIFSTSTGLTVKLINKQEDFSSLKTQWNELYAKCERSTIFSSWEWLFTWWEVFKDQYQRQLYILCFYQHDQLVGIAPLQIDKSYPLAFIQGKTLRFIGAGDAQADRILTEYTDLIVLPGFESEVVQATEEYLVSHKKDWNFADFEFLLKDALILQCFTSKKNKVSRQKIECGVRFTVSGLDSYDSYTEAMGSRWRKMLVKKERRLLRDGELKIETTETVESLKPAFDQLSKMHCSRWRARVGYCIFDSAKFKEFHKKIISRLLPLNKSFIKTITLDGEPLATYYAFTDKGQVHYYQSGFYSQYANRYSPLFILICKEIGLAMENKKVFDFMWADSKDSYKANQYAANYEEMYRLRWSSHPMRLFVFRGLKAMYTKSLDIYRCTDKVIREKINLKGK